MGWTTCLWRENPARALSASSRKKQAVVAKGLSSPPEVILPRVEKVTRFLQLVAVICPDLTRHFKYRCCASKRAKRFEYPTLEIRFGRHSSSFSRPRNGRGNSNPPRHVVTLRSLQGWGAYQGSRRRSSELHHGDYGKCEQSEDAGKGEYE